MPLIASAAIGAAGSLGGGLIGSKSSKKAAKQAAAANNAASRAIGTATNDANAKSEQVLSPYLQAGEQGVNSLAAAFAPGGDLTKQFSFDPSQIANNPNYQFVLQQGTDAVQKSAAAKGGLFSGGTMKAIDQYSQGLATQTVNDAYAQALNTFQANHNNMFQGLTTLSGIGQNATQQEEQGLNRFVQGNEAAADAYRGVGAAQAAGTAGAGNAWAGALQGITGNIQAAVNPNPYMGGQLPPDNSPYYQQQASRIPPLPAPLPPPVTPVPIDNWSGYTGVE